MIETRTLEREVKGQVIIVTSEFDREHGELITAEVDGERCWYKHSIKDVNDAIKNAAYTCFDLDSTMTEGFDSYEYEASMADWGVPREVARVIYELCEGIVYRR